MRRAEGVYRHLTQARGFKNVKSVDIPEWAGGFCYVVIRLSSGGDSAPMEILEAAASVDAAIGHLMIAVDEDIDAYDSEAVNWAMCWRMEPHKDIRVLHGRQTMLDSLATDPPEMPLVGYCFPLPGPPTSALLIDATLKRPYLPVSLPGKPFMERARELWEAEGLPTLQPKSIWYGYDLGAWTERDRDQAQAAIEGRYLETGAWAREQRRPIREVEPEEPSAPIASPPPM
jgi:3-polyprenyl-4-hydroxybenzoate decarboxylase